MAEGNYDVRSEVLAMLLEKVSEDEYPSNTMLDMIEGLLSPREVPLYAEMLMNKIRADEYPSIPMLRRLVSLR